MPSIKNYLPPNTVIGNGLTLIIESAFKTAKSLLQDESARELVALRILEATKRGEQNPEWLAEIALMDLKRRTG